MIFVIIHIINTTIMNYCFFVLISFACLANTAVLSKSVFDTEPKYDYSATDPPNFMNDDNFLLFNNPRIPQTSGEREDYRLKRHRRMEERKLKAKETMKEILHDPQRYMSDKAELVSEEEIELLKDDLVKSNPNLDKEQHRWLWNNDRSNSDGPHSTKYYADPGQSYDEWQQAYRMLGAFILCNQNENGSYQLYQGNGNGNGNGHNRHLGEGENNQQCVRWVMWAAVSV